LLSDDSELADGLDFDLTDSVPCEVEGLGDFFGLDFDAVASEAEYPMLRRKRVAHVKSVIASQTPHHSRHEKVTRRPRTSAIDCSMYKKNGTWR
jgi:hypothetical protein